MAIDFPNSPTVGQDYTSGTTTWTYNGVAWDLKTTTTASNDSMPVGSIMWFAITSTPTGWLPCNGATYNNTSYPNLVAVIGNTFGGTPGTNFMVPNISATTGAYYIRFTTAVGVTSTLSLLSAPVGSMVQWPVTSSYPTGWLRCDGSNISRTSFADLFALIGTTYGSGDGSSTFTLPNISAAGTGSPVYIIKATTSGLIEPSTVAHAASHVRAGSDIIDGDRVQVDYVPTTYTRDSSPAQAGAVTDLTAHLKGIDTRLNTVATQTAGGDLQGTYPNPTFKSGAAGDPIIWRPFNTSYNTEISYSGGYNSSFTVTTNVPTNARYILADVFVTANISDHMNIELGNTALANAQNWVNTRGNQPSTQFGNIARNSVILTYNGEADGYTPNYGMWYSSLTIPSSGRTVYMNNYGQSGSVGWVYLRVKAYSL